MHSSETLNSQTINQCPSKCCDSPIIIVNDDTSKCCMNCGYVCEQVELQNFMEYDEEGRSNFLVKYVTPYNRCKNFYKKLRYVQGIANPNIPEEIFYALVEYNTGDQMRNYLKRINKTKYYKCVPIILRSKYHERMDIDLGVINTITLFFYEFQRLYDDFRSNKKKLPPHNFIVRTILFIVMHYYKNNFPQVYKTISWYKILDKFPRFQVRRNIIKNLIVWIKVQANFDFRFLEQWMDESLDSVSALVDSSRHQGLLKNYGYALEESARITALQYPDLPVRILNNASGNPLISALKALVQPTPTQTNDFEQKPYSSLTDEQKLAYDKVNKGPPANPQELVNVPVDPSMKKQPGMMQSSTAPLMSGRAVNPVMPGIIIPPDSVKEAKIQQEKVKDLQRRNAGFNPVETRVTKFVQQLHVQ